MQAIFPPPLHPTVLGQGPFTPLTVKLLSTERRTMQNLCGQCCLIRQPETHCIPPLPHCRKGVPISERASFLLPLPALDRIHAGYPRHLAVKLRSSLEDVEKRQWTVSLLPTAGPTGPPHHIEGLLQCTFLPQRATYSGRGLLCKKGQASPSLFRTQPQLHRALSHIYQQIFFYLWRMSKSGNEQYRFSPQPAKLSPSPYRGPIAVHFSPPESDLFRERSPL